MSWCTADRSATSYFRYITEVQEDETFLSALEKIRDASQEGGPRFLRPLSKNMTSPRCSSRLLRQLNPSGMDVNIQLPVGQVCKQFGLFRKPSTEDQRDSGQQPRRNAFALLAEGARKEASASCLPEKKGIVGDAAVRGDWHLHNDLCQMS